MKNIKNFNEFSRLKEGLTLTSDEIPEIGDVVDDIKYNDGDKFAFVDFGDIKDIPIKISDSENINNEEE